MPLKIARRNSASVCVCVSVHRHKCVCECVYVSGYKCVCECVLEQERDLTAAVVVESTKNKNESKVGTKGIFNWRKAGWRGNCGVGATRRHRKNTKCK